MCMDYFLQIYGALPRAGPGSHEATRRAYDMMPDVPVCPRILDIGCGPGVQTTDLLEISNGTVLALDFLALMLDRTQANARRAQVSDRLEVLEQDMNQMDFPSASFDVIWSEGAIYNLGFEAGLNKVMRFVRPGGCVVVSEAVWLKPDPPAPVVEFWEQYPQIDTVENKLHVIDRLGYVCEGHFVLPDSAWFDDYYTPMQTLVDEKAKQWAGIADGMAVIGQARHEIEIFSQYSTFYGYAFFVMRRPVGSMPQFSQNSGSAL